ncbi:MAG TPA: glycosyltransferase family 2 protein [Halomonas sp.]|nr:glycosyltransferase family 2 protein [Halomonas sp.]
MDVSIIIPSYKSEDYIYRAVKSCVDEAVAEENIIVVEDGVFDDTGRVLSAFPKIQHIVLPQNKGGCYARNVGLHNVKTTYVIFLDSDDYIYGGLVKGLWVSACKSNSDIVYGPWRYEGEGVKNNKVLYPIEKSNISWMSDWLKGGFVPPCSVLWKKYFLDSIGGWDDSLKVNQDGELAFRALSMEPNISISHVGSGVYWQHNSKSRVSRSPKKNRLIANEVILETLNRYINYKNCEDVIELKASLGVFCCLNAWSAYADNDDVRARYWLDCAKQHGYQDVGYSKATCFLGKMLGVRNGAIFRQSLMHVAFMPNMVRFFSNRLNH